MRRFRVALAQINATVGDLEGNVAKIRAASSGRARSAAAWWPSRSWPSPATRRRTCCSSRRSSRTTCARSRRSRGPRAASRPSSASSTSGDDIFNAAAVLHDGRCAGVYHKQYLPNYGVFDENRYFQAGTETPVFVAGETTFGVNVCEDIWYPAGPTARPGAGRRRGDRQHQRLALPRRQGALPRADARDPRRGRSRCASATSTWSAGRTSWSSTAQPDRRTSAASCVARGRAVRGGLRRRRPRPRGGLPRPAARPAAAQGEAPGVAPSATRVVAADAARARGAAACRRARSRPPAPVDGGVRGAGARHARLRAEERLQAAWSSGSRAASTPSLVAADRRRRARARRTWSAWPCRRRYSSAGTRRDAQRLAKNLGIEFLTIPIDAALQRLQARAGGGRSRGSRRT